MTPHPLCTFLRTLRQRSHLSIAKAAAQMGMRDSVLGSWERQSRAATVTQLDEAYRFYGWRLAPVPAGITDAQIAEALAWITARQSDGIVELGAVA